MPGVPGRGGPPPKRSDQRRRRNSPVRPVTKAPSGGDGYVPPKAETKWHAVARQWYESLAVSGQSRYYEPSDWAVAFLLAESMSRDLLPQVIGFTDRGEVIKESLPLKGASISGYLKGCTQLLVTEGERRRVQLELQRRRTDEKGEEYGSVTWIDRYRDGGSG
jgi:hypothetical protein